MRPVGCGVVWCGVVWGSVVWCGGVMWGGACLHVVCGANNPVYVPIAPLSFCPLSPPCDVQVVLMGHENSVRAATYLPEGQRVVSADV